MLCSAVSSSQYAMVGIGPLFDSRGRNGAFPRFLTGSFVKHLTPLLPALLQQLSQCASSSICFLNTTTALESTVGAVPHEGRVASPRVKFLDWIVAFETGSVSFTVSLVNARIATCRQCSTVWPSPAGVSTGAPSIVSTSIISTRSRNRSGSSRSNH